MAAFLCVTSESTRAGIVRRGLLVLVAGTFSLSQNWWVARRMRQSHLPALGA